MTTVFRSTAESIEVPNKSLLVIIFMKQRNFFTYPKRPLGQILTALVNSITHSD